VGISRPAYAREPWNGLSRPVRERRSIPTRHDRRVARIAVRGGALRASHARSARSVRRRRSRSEPASRRTHAARRTTRSSISQEVVSPGRRADPHHLRLLADVLRRPRAATASFRNDIVTEHRRRRSTRCGPPM
jgi:hypothetical protein